MLSAVDCTWEEVDNKLEGVDNTQEVDSRWLDLDFHTVPASSLDSPQDKQLVQDLDISQVEQLVQDIHMA
jgi:hypothetical protein